MSCLFRSLSFYLKEMNEMQLRENICNFLQLNPTMMDCMKLEDILKIEGTELQHYVQGMRSEHTWGGAIEIKAFCELFKVAVEVAVYQNEKTILFQPSVPTNLVVRIEWTGNHFEPKPYSNS